MPNNHLEVQRKLLLLRSKAEPPPLPPRTNGILKRKGNTDDCVDRGKKKAKKHRQDERTCWSLVMWLQTKWVPASAWPSVRFPTAGSGAFPLATSSSCKIKKSLER